MNVWNANSTFKDPLWVYCKYVTSAEIYVVSGPICVFIIIAKFQSTGKCLLFSKKKVRRELGFCSRQIKFPFCQHDSLYEIIKFSFNYV